MVFYRKYRPQTISELDLVAVRERLTSILSGPSVPHAFLFTGPKGLGKTSAARILAKAINCEKNQESRSKKHGKKDEKETHNSKFIIHNSSIEPCNTCEACVSITKGSNIDVLEIDAASNRGIDEIRALRDKIKFSPSNLSKKVYIIDEVHMLTNEAFNALLKTLEEPPDHAVFILCTTETWKVPATIVSRSFHVSFEKPTFDEMLSSFKRIVKGENLDIEEGVLEAVSKLSDGAFRDGAKILEELSFAATGKKITKNIIETIFKTQNISEESKLFVEKLAERNAKEAFLILDGMAKDGSDFAFVTEKIAEYLRLQMFAKTGIKKDIEELNLEISEIEELLELVMESYKQLKFSILPQLPLELVVAKWCVNEVRKHESGIMNEEEDTKVIQSSKIKVQNGGGLNEKKDDMGKEGLESEKKEKGDGESTKIIQNSEFKIQNSGKTEVINESLKEKDLESAEKEVTSKKDFGELFDPNSMTNTFFTTLIERVKKDNHSIAGMLRGCKLSELSKEKVILSTKFKFHKDKLSEAKVRKILDTRASEILRSTVGVEVVLGN